MKSKKEAKIGSEVISQMVKLKDEGKSVNEIADIIKIKPFNVRYHLNKHAPKKPKKVKLGKRVEMPSSSSKTAKSIWEKLGSQPEDELAYLRAENKQLKEELLVALRRVIRMN
jgi:hypothetical protein